MLILHARTRQMSRWKLEYLKAIVRQDVGWFDVNKPQELASRIGEAILYIDKAHSVTTYQSLLPVGQLLGGVTIAFVFKWDLALIACALGFLLCAPASFVQMKCTRLRSKSNPLQKFCLSNRGSSLSNLQPSHLHPPASLRFQSTAQDHHQPREAARGCVRRRGWIFGRGAGRGAHGCRARDGEASSRQVLARLGCSATRCRLVRMRIHPQT